MIIVHKSLSEYEKYKNIFQSNYREGFKSSWKIEENEYGFSASKKYGKYFSYHVHHRPHTKLDNCKMCKRLFNKSWLRYNCFARTRAEANKQLFYDHGFYCIGCYTKVEAYNRKLNELIETKHIIYKALKEIKHVEKHQNSGRSAGVSHQHDDWSEERASGVGERTSHCKDSGSNQRVTIC